MACHNLSRSVADAIKVYKGPNHLSGKWLENANISVATPVHCACRSPCKIKAYDRRR
jgi:hypothetical protein